MSIPSATLRSARNVVSLDSGPFACVFGAGVSSGQRDANRVAIQAAYDYLGALGGGIVYTPPLGTLMLSASGSTSLGVNYCVIDRYDNIETIGSGEAATWKTPDDALVLIVNGAAKPAGLGTELAEQVKAQPPYAFSTAAKGAQSVTMSGGQSDITAMGLTAGDAIYIRTGQLVANGYREPQAELNYADVLPGSGVISLRYPLHIGFAQEYYDAGNVTTKTLGAAASSGATILTLSNTTSLTTNGWLNVAGSWVFYTAISGSTVTGVRGVPSGGFSSGAAVYQGLGVTSTVSTAYAAPFGVSRAEGRMIRGGAIRKMRFEALANTASSGSTVTTHFTEDFILEDSSSTGSWGMMNGTTNPGIRMRRNRARIIGGGYRHPWGVDTGSTRCEISSNRAVSDGVAFIHAHEACEVEILANRIANLNRTATSAFGGPVVDGGSNAISIRDRATARVAGNILDHPSGTVGEAIHVHANCTNDGRIEPNMFLGGHTTSVLFQSGATGWVLEDQNTTATITVPATGVRRVGVVAATGVAAVALRTTDATAVTAQTTPQADDTLKFDIASGETWWFKALLVFTAANATMDTRIDWTVPSGATMLWGAQGTAGNNLGGWGGAVLTISPVAVLTESSVLNFGSFAGTYGIGVEGSVTAAGSGGTVTLRRSQQTSDAGSLVLKAGSFIRMEKIA